MFPRIHACLAAILAASFATSADAASTRLLTAPAANITLYSAACDIHAIRRTGQLKATTFKIFVLNTGKLPFPAGTKLKVDTSNTLFFDPVTLSADLAPGAEIETFTVSGPDSRPQNCTVKKL